MTRVTDFRCVHEQGHEVRCDAYGNNVAFQCPDCGHPMLAIVLPKQSRRGSSAKNPAVCRHCSHGFWVEADPAKKRLVLRACG